MTDVTLTPEQFEALKAAILADMAPTSESFTPGEGALETGDYIVTCRTPGCEGEGEGIPFTLVEVHGVICGACGNPITDIVPVAESPDEVPPKAPAEVPVVEAPETRPRPVEEWIQAMQESAPE